MYDKLDPVQQQAVEWLLPRKGAGLYAEQGVGKTWITAGLVERLLPPDLLIVGILTNLESTWLELFRNELPQIHMARTLDGFKKLPQPRCLLIHYEALRSIIERVKRLDWSLVVFDEAQRLNNRNSLQSRCARFLRTQERRLALTGTPIEQSPQDIWGQMRFIDPGVFGERWSTFSEEYMENDQKHRFLKSDGSIGYKQIFREDKRAQFLTKVKPYCLRIELSEVVKVDSEFKIETCPMFGEQARVYREIDKDLITTFRDKEATAPLRITAMMRAQQIVGGFLTTDDGEVMEVGKAKMRRLASLLKELEPPVVIFAKYKPEILAIERLLIGKRVEKLWGGTGSRKTRSADRANLNKRFQAGEMDYLINQSRTGGVGVDLFRARYAIIYSIGFSSIEWEQAKSRLVRRGQKHKVTFFFLRVPKTIDDDQLSAIKLKTSVARAIYERLRRR